MRKLLLIAGAGMMAAIGAQADAQKGKAKAGASAKVRIDANRNGILDFRERALADINLNGIPDFRERRVVDINRNGIADFRERMIDINRDGIDDRLQIRASRFGGQACPPGLAKRIPGCVPPGQVGRTFAVGQRVPTGFGTIPFRRIPLNIRDQFDLDDDDVFIHRGDTLIVIDPRTRLVERIIESVVF
jgi:hypothetical protein